ncbi:M28 family peptidase [Carboxylicivirga linearis]|uniref:M28 family peptidase n=1 Tax=Carboxylicivirga linearis TaxID=1628157 RepID=A0ABS5JTE3_9BACT|nr:M28 family peptidase [Carboxylicivirga linearis]MBS2098149.1 M28 family peptidase [Carboxylicivirga linearis]
MRTFYLLLFSLFFLGSAAQNSELKNVSATINIKTLKKHISVLAADSLNGRYTTSEGQKKAANYIRNEFNKAGLHPYNDTSFYQTFSLWSWRWGKCELKVGDILLQSYKDFIYRCNSPLDSINTDCVFVGYGEDDIINNIDLQDKVAFAFTKSYSNYYHLAYRLKSKGVKAIILTNPKDKNSFTRLVKSEDPDHVNVSKAKPFFSKTATRIYIVNPSLTKTFFNKNSNVLSQINTLEEAKKIKSQIISANCPAIVEKVKTENVIGYLKGKSDETIVISAHYDHIGKKGSLICNGADDNASGTSALITLANTYAQQTEIPDRSILFLATSGEELGLLGALHFADHQQELPFDIKANLNIDMIGRRDSTHKSNYIYIIGGKEYPVLDSLCNVANKKVGLTLDYGYAGRSSFGNILNLSDHYAFHKQGIPILGFFNGLHPDYHKPTDTIDKIEFDEMLKRVQLIYLTGNLLVNKQSYSNN